MIEIDRATVVVDETTLLAPVTAKVSAGESLVVRGRNGSGKSTLLGLLAGRRRPSSGDVRVAGIAASERDRDFRRRVAAMIGLPPMAPDLTVRDHAELVAATWWSGRSEAFSAAASILDELDLARVDRRFPHELSSGQAQLFGLALVLVRPAEVLLVDEPEQRLDPEHVETVVEAMRTRLDAGATIVTATHSALLAESLGGATLRLEPAA